MTDQELVLVFGLEHGKHFLQVAPVTLVVQVGKEEDGDDPLGDVGQVEVIVSLHHSLHDPLHTLGPAEEDREREKTLVAMRSLL